MKNLTKNFTLEELTHSSTAIIKKIDNSPNEDEYQNLIKLAAMLQIIRDYYGQPIIVSSGFRCKKLNKAVGGASNSDHLFGCAADISSASNSKIDNKKLFDLICSLIANEKIELRQLIDEKEYSWIHLSINNLHNGYKRNQILHL